MLFTDGECPLCNRFQLHLNELDLLECPNCNIMYLAADSLTATVMPKLGSGRFRIEDSDIHHFNGALIAKSLDNFGTPDYKQTFNSIDDLRAYRDLLVLAAQESLFNSLDLSKKFLNAFRESILQCDPRLLDESWPLKPQRTQLYAEFTIPEIARNLNLIHKKERFTVDHALVKLSINDHEIPQIYIESENEFMGATHEIIKLCSLNSPVRALITATTKEFLPRPSAGAYGKIREWQAIIRSHHEENSLFNGTLVVIVGRLIHKKIIFNACAFHPDGALALPMSVLVERDLD